DQRRGVRILASPHESGAMLRANVPELAYERRRALEHARVMLGDESFAAECSAGQAFTLEEAALEALRDTTVEQGVSTAARPLTRAPPKRILPASSPARRRHTNKSSTSSTATRLWRTRHRCRTTSRCRGTTPVSVGPAFEHPRSAQSSARRCDGTKHLWRWP